MVLWLLEWWPFWLLFLLVFGLVMYQLYYNGYAVSKSIMALVFIFHPGKDADRANVNSCSGWVSHVGQFRESRIYEFVLEARLTQGDVEVLLLDQEKQPLLRLNRWHPGGHVALDGNSRYFLRWEFSKASGQCELRW